MKKIGIFYGSTTGYTADLAQRVAKALGVDMKDVHDVADTAPSAVGDYDVLLLGASTWGDGDLQDNFADFLDGVDQLDLPGKAVAVFGCGDENMTRTFGAALGEIYRRMEKTQANIIAPYNTDGYTFEHSPAIIDGKCVGLLIDEVNHPELTDKKVKEWASIIQKEID